MGATKNFNKTILQTSFTSLESIYYLLQTVKNNQPMTSADGKDTIFPVARARISQARGGEWSEDNRDTHAELTLKEMRFIRYLDENETTFEVSDAGHDFLNAFNLVESPAESGKVTLSLEDRLTKDEKNQLLFDVLVRISVINKNYGRNIRPYLVLFKLLTEQDLGNYITKDEWACFINSSDYLLDSQYPEIRDRIIEFRRNHESCEAKKSDRILTRLVLWNVLEKVTVTGETKMCFSFNPDFGKTVVINMIQGKNSTERDEAMLKPEVKEKAKFGANKIFYGAPGCGKSRHVSDMLDEASVAKNNIIRVTFHPEYANCDFIGQILPTIETKVDEATGEEKEIVKYIFNPGPFTLALQTAYDTNDMVFLIVEEINRGNAAAIFGDMFQLLDRVKDSGKPNYCASEYPVSNPNLQKYLIESISDEAIKTELQNGVFIPSNLTIYATMNSSDQNVFTLDTAFKRRWSFEQISNNIKADKNHTFKNWYIPGTNVTWATFVTLVNNNILRNTIHNQTNEDKRLGKYFVTKECLTENIEDIKNVEDIASNFAYKVLEYLWNDVCKIGREDWFDTALYPTLEDLINAFVHPFLDNNPLSIFKGIDFKGDEI